MDTTSLSTNNGTKGNPLELNRRKDNMYPLIKTCQLADTNVAIKAHMKFVHKGRHTVIQTSMRTIDDKGDQRPVVYVNLKPQGSP